MFAARHYIDYQGAHRVAYISLGLPLDPERPGFYKVPTWPPANDTCQRSLLAALVNLAIKENAGATGDVFYQVRVSGPPEQMLCWLASLKHPPRDLVRLVESP